MPLDKNIRCNSDKGDDSHIEGDANDDHKPKHSRKPFYVFNMDLLPSFTSLLPLSNYLRSFVKESKDNSTDERQDAESQTYNDGKLPYIMVWLKYLSIKACGTYQQRTLYQAVLVEYLQMHCT